MICAANALKVGDKIHSFKWLTDPGWTLCPEPCVVKTIGSDHSIRDEDGQIITWTYASVVFRVIIDETASKPKRDTGRWNGECKTCGAGTYTGLTSVEHDGPCL